MTALLAEVGLLVLAPVLFALAEYFGWGAGGYRCAALFALFACVAWCTRGRLRLRSRFACGRALFVLPVAAALLVVVHARTFVLDITHGATCMTDMGRPSICAGEWLLKGLNPWAECAPREQTKKAGAALAFCLSLGDCVDPKYGGTYQRWQHHGTGFDFMDGYKYGPLMALVYLPFTHRYLERGLFLANLGAWLVLLGLLYALAKAAFPRVRAAPWRALVVLLLPAAIPWPRILPKLEIHALNRSYELWPPDPMMVVRQLTLGCSNDAIPMVFVLGAVLLAARRHSFSAGVLCGLSLASKQLPGLLVALLLVRLAGVDWRRFALGTVVAASVFYLPWFLGAPREMFANLVLFGASRPTNSSSIRRFLPSELEAFVSLAQLAFVLVLAVRFHRSSERDLPAFLRAVTLVLIAFVALNKVVHGNYFLWLEPLVAVLLAGAPFAPAETAVATPPRSDACA